MEEFAFCAFQSLNRSNTVWEIHYTRGATPRGHLHPPFERNGVDQNARFLQSRLFYPALSIFSIQNIIFADSLNEPCLSGFASAGAVPLTCAKRSYEYLFRRYRPWRDNRLTCFPSLRQDGRVSLTNSRSLANLVVS